MFDRQILLLWTCVLLAIPAWFGASASGPDTSAGTPPEAKWRVAADRLVDGDLASEEVIRRAIADGDQETREAIRAELGRIAQRIARDPGRHDYLRRTLDLFSRHRERL
jgi:hypothetical protein